jgi:signal transduction histidine kinase
MSLLRYLKDKVALLLIGAFAIALVMLVLHVFGLDASQKGFVCGILITALACGLAFDFLRRRRFYQELATTIEQLDKSYLISELIERPGFYEGELTYEALARSGKDMNDAIASYRIASEDYREYIEAWIHEIKTPIAAAHLIVENNRTATELALEVELERIEAFVEQALYYSRSSTLEKDYRIRELNLNDAVKASLRKHSRALIESKVVPRLDNLAVSVFTDAKWLDFILGQIIGNAIKYRKPENQGNQNNRNGHDNGEALLRFSTHQGQGANIILRIEDNGIGIPPEDIDRVFYKGFTGINGRSFAKSTGIGLYLCKKLCDKMGLTIQLDSKQHEGTCVSIGFPLDRLRFVE